MVLLLPQASPVLSITVMPGGYQPCYVVWLLPDFNLKAWFKDVTRSAAPSTPLFFPETRYVDPSKTVNFGCCLEVFLFGFFKEWKIIKFTYMTHINISCYLLLGRSFIIMSKWLLEHLKMCQVINKKLDSYAWWFWCWYWFRIWGESL